MPIKEGGSGLLEDTSLLLLKVKGVLLLDVHLLTGTLLFKFK